MPYVIRVHCLLAPIHTHVCVCVCVCVMMISRANLSARHLSWQRHRWIHSQKNRLFQTNTLNISLTGADVSYQKHPPSAGATGTATAPTGVTGTATAMFPTTTTVTTTQTKTLMQDLPRPTLKVGPDAGTRSRLPCRITAKMLGTAIRSPS